jgi:hypothetical protein
MTASTDAIGEARSDAEDAYDKVRPENQSVVLDGMTFGDHERIDSCMDAPVRARCFRAAWSCDRVRSCIRP